MSAEPKGLFLETVRNQVQNSRFTGDGVDKWERNGLTFWSDLIRHDEEWDWGFGKMRTVGRNAERGESAGQLKSKRQVKGTSSAGAKD
jgi:hypothetical protein